MRKVIALFSIIMIVLLAFSIGCGKEETKRTVTSRPVSAKSTVEATQTAEPAAATTEEAATTTAPAEETTTPSFSSGGSDCEQLGSEDIAAVFAGTWAKTSDCPQKPAMPKGVSVCICSYDGPKQVYVNVETQKYDDATQADRVYNMYCKGTKEENEVGEKSCRQTRSSQLTPNFVYFLKGSNFVKVSCLGGTCQLDGVVLLAKTVEGKI